MRKHFVIRIAQDSRQSLCIQSQRLETLEQYCVILNELESALQSVCPCFQYLRSTGDRQLRASEREIVIKL